MDPKNPESDGWSAADITAMLTGRDDARQASTPYYRGQEVELSPGFQHDEGEYVVDPDFAEIMGIDYEDLVRNKINISRG